MPMQGFWGARQRRQIVDISPSGTRVMYHRPGPGQSDYRSVVDIDDRRSRRSSLGEAAIPKRSIGAISSSEPRWSANMAAMSMSMHGDRLASARLIAIDIGGKDVKQLGQRDRLS